MNKDSRVDALEREVAALKAWKEALVVSMTQADIQARVVELEDEVFGDEDE